MLTSKSNCTQTEISVKQLIQNYKTGELKVDEIADPSVADGFILVENRFSLISAGTEKSTVSMAKASLLEKARKRPELVRQVMQNMKKEGLLATYQKVRTKLETLKALGYSCSGVVSLSLDSQGTFHPGDRVVCAGQDYASHAEVVSVPQNLVAHLPENVSFQEGALSAVGSIALQGVRQAGVGIADNVCVIGLGLIGQLTGLILRSAGCNVFGIDVAEQSVKTAIDYSCHSAIDRSSDSVISAANDFTGGHGFDAVIITAAAPTNDPILLAAELLRRKGRMIIVGAVRMDIPRDPHFYRKELELRMSCSYGPGRYDHHYEEEGVDYPYDYVRWTEQRNMEAFLNLISNKAINVNPLITHVFDIENAEKAFDIVLGKVQERFIGILLRYKEEGPRSAQSPSFQSNVSTQEKAIGFIGAGSFAQSYLIPNCDGFPLDTVVTRTGITAKNVASKFKFRKASTDPLDILKNPSISTVFIATQHDTHARYAADALSAGKNVFVEKPLALNRDELSRIESALTSAPQALLLVGFNRRFSSLAATAHAAFAKITEPKVITIRVNAGFIAKNHWTQTAAGGGRILGEMCHFVDLMQFLTGASPVKVFAACIHAQNERITDEDNCAVTICFSDGSIGNLVYVANGDKALPKERIEISSGEKSYVINDFRSGELFSINRRSAVRLSGKGHREEVQAFLKAILAGGPSPIPFESLKLTTLATFAIRDALVTGLPQEIQEE
jgi:predicted dehydrogenase/threonine dehydrogenase-like Zn-dependent dehydrogenase